MRTILTSLAALLVTSACATTDQHEDEEMPLPEGVENCLHLSAVDRIEILDEQHILFFMRDRKTYNNHLSGKCPGLRRNDTIMYRTTLNQLCNIDMFTVLENIGGGFMPGATCSFGKFYPATQEEVDALKARQRD
jgi:hypothetical protein